MADSHSQADDLIDGAGLALKISGARKCLVCMDDELYEMIEVLKARLVERGISPKWDALFKSLKAQRPAFRERGPKTAKSLKIHAEDHNAELRRLAVAQ